jgi:DNA-binding NtrC family response regulator
MDLRLQSKLLRAIQEKEIDRVGGSQPVKVDVRILATSNRNLQEAVSRGTFREDLFFRLNVVDLPLPALRERPLDIPVLAEHFVARFAETNDMPKPTLTPEALQRLESYPWPGNVRELENTMHRTVLLASGHEIGPDDLLFTGSAAVPAPAAGTAVAADGLPGEAGTRNLVGRTVADVERDLIIDTLHHCLGNRTHASTILGISIRTLRNKLRQYGEEGFAVPQPGEGDRQTA